MLPQLDPTWYASQAAWMLITFCATFLLMWKAVLPRISSVTDERRRRLDDDMKKAETFKAEAESVLKEYQSVMASANERARSILENAKKEIAEHSKARGDEFSKRLEHRIADGEKELNETKEQALAGVRDIAAGLVPEAVFKLSGIRPREETTAKEVEEIIKERRL